MHRKFIVALTAIISCLIVWSPAYGQSVPDQDSAELAFEIRMDQLRETPLYAMIKQAADQANAQSGMSQDIDFDKVKRVWGAVQFPETVEEMQAMENLGPGDSLPMELFVQIEFEDAASADSAMNQMMEESEEVTRNGKTYFAPKSDANAPANLLGHKLNDTTIQAGTEGYIAAGASDSLFASGLSKAWGSFSGEPIRIAFDLDNARTLMDQAMEMGKADVPPMMHGMLDLISKTSHVRVSMDFKDGGNLLAIGAAGTDEDSAETLRSGLDGMLGMAKMMGGGQVEQLRAVDDGLADVVASILASLKATRDGADVNIVIPKPEGFDDAVQRMMQMNGMGNDF